MYFSDVFNIDSIFSQFFCQKIIYDFLMFFIILSILFLRAKVNSIGATRLSIDEPSVIDISLDQSDLSSYSYFSNYPPNYTYVSTKNSEKVYLEDRYMFISNQDTSLHIENPMNGTLDLTIWIIPTNICSNNARIFKTSQAIFSHWVFTKELDKMCYFPINNAETEADITFLPKRKFKANSHLTFYASNSSGSLNVFKNLTKSQKFGPYNVPFFISLENAKVGTIFAYKLHFSHVDDDVCIDEPFQYLNHSNASFISTFSSIDEPSFACSNDHDNNIIKSISVGLVIFILLIVLLFAFMIIRAYFLNRKIKYS